MIAVVEEDVLQRLHGDVVPLDLSIILNVIRPEKEWLPRSLFDGTEVLFPPGTNIGEDAEGNWILLNIKWVAFFVSDAERRPLFRRHFL